MNEDRHDQTPPHSLQLHENLPTSSFVRQGEEYALTVASYLGMNRLAQGMPTWAA